MDDVIFRRAKPEDAPELTALALASKRHWGYDESLIDLWRDELKFTPELIDRNVVVVAERADQLVGVVAISDVGDSRELEHLWVHPTCIGQGIGTSLFRRAVAEATTADASAIEIIADPHAEPFYLALGARRMGTVPSTPEGRQLPRLLFNINEPDPKSDR